MENPEKKKAECPNCIGVGVVFSPMNSEDAIDGIEQTCSVCNGEGIIYDHDGDNYLIDTRTDEFLPEDEI